MQQIITQAGPLIWPLIALSFLSVTFIVERLLFFGREFSKRQPRYVHLILQNVERGHLDRAENLARKAHEDFVARTLLSGLEHRRHSLTEALETQALVELRRMKKYLMVLNTTITAAPLLGILGTVVGIIFSFDILGAQGVSDPMLVTKGISQALITTAFGLSIALITLVPYNYFQSRCEEATEDIEKFSSMLEMIIQKLPREISGSPLLDIDKEVELKI